MIAKARLLWPARHLHVTGRIRLGWTARARAGRYVRGPAATLIERALINHLNVTRDTAANPFPHFRERAPGSLCSDICQRPATGQARVLFLFMNWSSRGRAHNYVRVPK